VFAGIRAKPLAASLWTISGAVVSPTATISRACLALLAQLHHPSPGGPVVGNSATLRLPGRAPAQQAHHGEAGSWLSTKL
jgi:hypothetical protein